MISNQHRTTENASEALQGPGPDDWRALLRTGANMLLVGPRPILDAFLAAAADYLKGPVHLVTPADIIPVDCRGTLVMYDASSLAQSQQDALMALTGADAERPQIISLSETHLWRADGPLAVPVDLYYRLNTICLDLRDVTSIQAVSRVQQSIKTA